MARSHWTKLVAIGAAVVLIAGCASSDESGSDGDTDPSGGAATTIDVTTVGLWDDGACDTSLEPLEVGLMATFQSPVLTAQDQAFALEAAATAFNGRGGANGHCIHVTTCDEKANTNAALACVKTLDDAGISATVNDATASTPGPEVGDAYKAAKIPRFATSSAANSDLSDPNSYPIDAGGLGTTLVMPQALLDLGIKKIATVRVDLPNAAALIGLFKGMYGDDGADFVADIPVTAGTTDYSQFILSAQDAGAEGVVLPLGGQEAIQVLRAAQQLNSKLVFSTSLGTLPYADLADLGDFASQIVLNGSTPPVTADVPVLQVLNADLSASGKAELQPEQLKNTASKSWIGLYALLDILRAAKTDDFSRENVKKLIDASGPIDMLGLTADWTPNTTNPGVFGRTGNGYYAFWKWDPKAGFGDQDGNLTKSSEADFNDLICGSAVGAPAATCG